MIDLEVVIWTSITFLLITFGAFVTCVIYSMENSKSSSSYLIRIVTIVNVIVYFFGVIAIWLKAISLTGGG